MSKKTKANNFKSGLLYFLFFGLAVTAFMYLQKNDWFTDNNTFKIVLDDASGLSKGGPVHLRGIKVGRVQKIYINPENPSTIAADIKIKGKYDIPKDAVAVIVSAGVLGGKIINIEMKGFCSGDYCAKDGDELRAVVPSLLESFTSGEVDENSEQARIQKNIEALVAQVKDKYMSPNSNNTVSDILKNMDFLELEMNTLQGDLGKVMERLDKKSQSITSSLTSIQDNMNRDGKADRAMADADLIMKQLEALEIDPTMEKADATMKRVDGMKLDLDTDMDNMNETMSRAEKTMNELGEMMEEAKNGDNTLSYIMDKERFTKDMEKTTASLNQLSQNYENKPYLFIPFKNRRKFYKKKNREDKKAKTE